MMPADSVQAQETLNTRIDELRFAHDFANSFPLDETIAHMFDEIDYQRAYKARLVQKYASHLF